MKRHFPTLLFLLCAAALAFGIVQLFKLRFAVGDVYPPYSSLRSDPLGTMVLYESLERMPDLEVKRDFTTGNQLPEGRQTVYLHLAAGIRDWRRIPDDLFNEIDRFVNSGGRLAISMHPKTAGTFAFGEWDDDPKTNSVPAKRAKENADDGGEKKEADEKLKPGRKRPVHPDENPRSKRVSLTERWGFGFHIIDLDQGDDDVYEPVAVENKSSLSLPERLDWHSGIVLTNIVSAWKTIYARGTNAVVVERRFGRGSVVIATDSYFLSNEAMQGDRHADLLAWFVGPSRNVFFDEAHLGVLERPGMATLLRKYRLYWLVGGLVLLAGLFIWKNAFSLVPPHPAESDRGHVVGKDASAGIVNLLRRSIPADELLATCFAEWKKSAATGGRYSTARLQQAEAIFQAECSLPAKARNPQRAYQQICEALEVRNLPPSSSEPKSSLSESNTLRESKLMNPGAPDLTPET
jgi:hypothetical protein